MLLALSLVLAIQSVMEIKKNTIDLIWVQTINKSYTGHNLILLLHICLLHSSEFILPYSLCSLYHKSFSFISLLYNYCWFSRDSQLDWDLRFECQPLWFQRIVWPFSWLDGTLSCIKMNVGTGDVYDMLLNNILIQCSIDSAM